MIGIIERIKNNVLLKCSTLNDEIISKTLKELLDTKIYRFSEEMISLVGILNLSEEELRNKVKELISKKIIKKIKRKLFIDSLALQITNDSFAEDYVNNKITINEIKNKYISELNKNKNSNQLNMTEDLDLTEIFVSLNEYVNTEIEDKVKENNVLANSVSNLTVDFKNNLELDLKQMIDQADLDYLGILLDELKEVEQELPKEDKKEEVVEEGEDIMISENEELVVDNNAKFEKYDDMTLFNKLVLCLNTSEEKLSRKEQKLAQGKKQVEERLTTTNKNIESNIDRENKLSQRQLELSNREMELNSKLSEAEVIFLNMKPLIKGLSKITSIDENGGSENE